jgi:hypothetical protein
VVAVMGGALEFHPDSVVQVVFGEVGLVQEGAL